MRKDLTDITVVMDRSGSMQTCRDDAEGGLNAFIEKQREQPGEALFTLVQFDDRYEFVHRGVPIKQVPRCKLEPRGWTALLDAVGRAVQETGNRLANMAEADRPGLVVFVILTDGYENRSTEFTREQVRAMIRHQQDAYKWQFTFLGADLDAFAVAGGLGIPQGAALRYRSAQTAKVFGMAADHVAVMRAASAAGRSVSVDYSDEERKAAQG